MNATAEFVSRFGSCGSSVRNSTAGRFRAASISAGLAPSAPSAATIRSRTSASNTIWRSAAGMSD